MATRTPPDPHLWAPTADELYPLGGIGRVAREYVQVRTVPYENSTGRAGTVLKLSLATNIDFSDPRRNEHTAKDPRLDLGVPWPAEGREYAWGAEAISARLLVELVRRDTLHDWTERELAVRPPEGNLGRRGYRSSVRRLAEDLLNTGIQAIIYRAVPALKPIESAVRAVERWRAPRTAERITARNAPLRPTQAYRGRVELLRGGPARAAREYLATLEPVLGVHGDWYFSSEYRPGVLLDNAPDDGGQAAQDVLTGKGRGFVEFIEDLWKTEENALELVRLHGLHVEVILP